MFCFIIIQSGGNYNYFSGKNNNFLYQILYYLPYTQKNDLTPPFGV